MKLQSFGRVGRVVESSQGLVASAGRRVHRIQDGTYVGAATDLQPLPEEYGVDGGLAFVLQGSQGATVGIMGPNVRVLDSETIPGMVRSIRTIDGLFFAVGDTEMIAWKIAPGGQLHDPQFIPVKGARDLDLLRENYYAVGGTFGRSMYRLKGDGEGDGDTFFASERSPGRLSSAVSDRRRILAGSEEGNWMYLIGGTPLLSDKALNATTSPRRRVTLPWGEVSINNDGKGLTMDLNRSGTLAWTPPGGGDVYALETAQEHLWVGHDEGFEVLLFDVIDEQPVLRTLGSVTMEGPVFWLFKPQVGDQIAFVSVYGGIGSAEVVPDPQASPSLLRRVDGEDVEKVEKEMREQHDLPETGLPY